MESVGIGGPTRKAISYVRFSSARQEHGFSFVRQMESTKEFCRRHNLRLDESLTITDLGKSAFNGANADSGNLAVFLEAIRQKKVRKGTVLVVEALDRLTRNRIIDASHLLTDILRHGIDVGLVSEDKIYSYDYINKNPFEFVVATTYLIRGGDESRMKSERIKDAWVRKKRAIAESKKVIKIPHPCWLTHEGGEWKVIEEKAAIVRRIFREYAKHSLGIWMLSHELNNAKVPVITKRGTKESKWHRITLHRFLTDKAVMGTYTRMEPPVENYFPAIVSEKEFYAVQRKLKERRQCRGRHSLKDVSFFKGVCKCGRCGGTMSRITRTRKKKGGGSVLYRYLYCHNSILGICKPATCVNLTKLENAFLKYAFTSPHAGAWISGAYSNGASSTQDALNAVDGEIADKKSRRERLLSAIEDASEAAPDVVLRRIQTLTQEIEGLRGKRDEILSSFSQFRQLPSAYEEFESLGRSLLNNDSQEVRLKFREVVRRFITSMTVYPEKREAKFTTIAGKRRELKW